MERTLTNTLKYVAWRGGFPRFIPGPRERALGFAGEDLKHPDGTWFGRAEAKAWAAARAIEIDAARQVGARIAVDGKAIAVPSKNTLGELLTDWLDSDSVKGKSIETQKSYRWYVNAVMKRPDGEPERIASVPVDTIGKPQLRSFFEYAVKARSISMANQMIAVISAAWTWGAERTKWEKLPPNPRFGMKFEAPEGRIAVYTLEEFDAYIAAADELEVPSIGDAIYLGLYTGQRQKDRLAFKDGGLIDGKQKFVQSKTGAVVLIPPAPELAARLAAARKRVAALKLAKATRPDVIVVNEATGLPWNVYTFRKKFREVRAAAAAKLPSCARLRDQDLRDTCVTLLFRSGNELLDICSITGHSVHSAELIRKHYLGDGGDRANKAIDRLAEFIARGRAT